MNLPETRDPHCHLPDHPTHPNLLLPHERPFDEAHVNDELKSLEMVDWRLGRIRTDLVLKLGKGENYVTELCIIKGTVERLLTELGGAADGSSKTRRASGGERADICHWYQRPAERQASSVINNIWNATSNWGNTIQNNPAGLLTTMRVQVDNLVQVINEANLYGEERALITRLIAEVRQALYSINPAFLNQQAQHTAIAKTTMCRSANDRNTISSNAKAAMGCMAYLQDARLFPGSEPLYQYIRERLEQIFRIMDGDYRSQDVQQMRQQGQTTNPSSSNSDYAVESYGTAQIGLSSNPQTPSSQGQSSPAPVPLASTPPVVTEWAASNGTTPEAFRQRVQSWVASHGNASVGQHLSGNGIPAAVVSWVLSR